MKKSPDKEFEILIKPAKGGNFLDLAELWNFRGLILSMSQQQVRRRFYDMYLGLFWSVARPVLMTLVFIFIKNVSSAQMGVDIIPYALYLFSGLVFWFFFAVAVNETANSLSRDAGLVQKVYFPRLVSPVSSVFSRSIDLLVGAIIIMGMMVYFDMEPTFRLGLLPAILVQTAMLILGVGLIFSALMLISRDWEQLLGLILYIGLFVSPVIYSPKMIPEGAQLFFSLNPMVGSLSALRSCLFEPVPFPVHDWLYSLAFSVCALLIGLIMFKRAEHKIIDKL